MMTNRKYENFCPKLSRFCLNCLLPCPRFRKIKTFKLRLLIFRLEEGLLLAAIVILDAILAWVMAIQG